MVKVYLPQGHMPSHVSVASNVTAATSVVATSGYFGATCWPVAEINARQVIFPAPVTIHVTKRLQLRLFHISLPVLSTFMARMLKESLPTSMQTSSPNMPVTLPRSRVSNGTWTYGICLIPSSFLPSSTLTLCQWKIAGLKGN